MKVTILDKSQGCTWSAHEVSLLVSVKVETGQLPAMPYRLVAYLKPRDGLTFQQVLGHSDFTEREVDIAEKWNP